LASALLAGGATSLLPDCVSAQLVPDATLGAESSTVAPFSPTIDVIRGGALRGINLFHSFRDFNIGVGRDAYFLFPSAAIQNVFARVTGTNRSDIAGNLGVRNSIGGAILPSTANLFLINPNGIVFGAGATLDVGGSFVATTANAIQLGANGLFSASAPATSNLLSVNPSAFLFNAIASQNVPEIVVRSNAANPLGSFGLQVPDGQNLLLVGGNVRLEGGIVQAWGGRVELSGLRGAGTIGLTPLRNFFALNVPMNAYLADVTLTNSLTSPFTTFGIDVSAGGGGSITVNARNLTILEGGILQAGIRAGFETATNRAGDIILNGNYSVLKDRGGF
jgi:filamentous hemagglutinin family protein